MSSALDEYREVSPKGTVDFLYRLSDLVKGRTAEDVAAMPKEELLDELGIPLTPVRLKCAILGLGVLKLALHKARGTPLPEEWGTSRNELVLE